MFSTRTEDARLSRGSTTKLRTGRSPRQSSLRALPPLPLEVYRSQEFPKNIYSFRYPYVNSDRKSMVRTRVTGCFRYLSHVPTTLSRIVRSRIFSNLKVQRWPSRASATQRFPATCRKWGREREALSNDSNSTPVGDQQ